MFREYSRAILGALVLALISGCAGWIGGDRRDSNSEIILVSFGSTNGELAPCG